MVLTQENIEDLEKVDRILLKNILNTGANTPKPMLYLELGCLRIGTIIKCRRLNFLHYLLSTDKEKTLFKFFTAQWKYPNKSDWTETVRQETKRLLYY